MVNTNISESEKIAANTRVEKIVIKFEPPCICDIHEISFGDPPTPSQWIIIFKNSSTNVNEHLKMQI